MEGGGEEKREGAREAGRRNLASDPSVASGPGRCLMSCISVSTVCDGDGNSTQSKCMHLRPWVGPGV